MGGSGSERLASGAVELPPNARAWRSRDAACVSGHPDGANTALQVRALLSGSAVRQRNSSARVAKTVPPLSNHCANSIVPFAVKQATAAFMTTRRALPAGVSG